MNILDLSEKDRNQIYAAVLIIQGVLDKNNADGFRSYINDLKNKSIISIDFWNNKEKSNKT